MGNDQLYKVVNHKKWQWSIYKVVNKNKIEHQCKVKVGLKNTGVRACLFVVSSFDPK